MREFLRRGFGVSGGLVLLWAAAAQGESLPVLQNTRGLRLVVAPENTDPTLALILPGYPDSDRSIDVIFPEHATVRKHGASDVEHLYLFQPGQRGSRPVWRRNDNVLEYSMDFPGGVSMLARAIFERDGVRFHYEFTNRSEVAYDLAYAVTDPRLTGIFHDVRLERTYVHHTNGFELLASETPARLTMPLDRWLPARYLVSYTWPVPQQRVEKQADGITYYNKSRAVDMPLIVTVSTDQRWMVASFTRTAGNVWSNPELTCQHVDPEVALPARGKAMLEVKMLVIPGSLHDAWRNADAQRNSIR